MISSYRSWRSSHLAARQRRFVALWRTGLPVRDLAGKLGLAETACYTIACELWRGKHRKDIELGKRNRRICRFWARGRSADNIVKVVGVPREVVQRVVGGRGLRRSGPSRVERMCLALRKKGVPAPEIEARLGLRPRAASYIAGKYGARGQPTDLDLRRAKRNRRIKVLWEKGVPVKEIARQVGLSRQGLYLIADECGFVRPYVPPARHEVVLRLCERGKTAAEIAKATGYALGWVRTLLQRYGKKARRPPRTQCWARDQRILRMWDRGVAAREIAEKHGLTVGNICRIAHKHGRRRRLRKSGKLPGNRRGGRR